MIRPAIFLDRDGVINEDIGFVHRAEDVVILPGVISGLWALQELGYALILVTNQSGIGRGYYSEEEFTRLNTWMLSLLEDEGIGIQAVYHCPHAPEDDCDCRKPKPGMILRAAREHQIDLARSWMIGDKTSDIAAARNAGIHHRVLVRTGQFQGAHAADALVVNDMNELVGVLRRKAAS